MAEENILAIVGSRTFQNPDAYTLALKEIVETIRALRPTRIISGGAEGIDTFARTIAELQGIPCSEHRPKNPKWEPDGYKERNEEIARECTHLLSIRCEKAKTYGSGWTADEAERIGKHVRRITIPAK